MAADSLHDLTDPEIVKAAKFALSCAERSGPAYLAEWAQNWGRPALEAIDVLFDRAPDRDDPLSCGACTIGDGRRSLAIEIDALLKAEADPARPPDGRTYLKLAAMVRAAILNDMPKGSL